jgi:L-threonylcarbamoyladenylate synthase
VDTVVCTTDTPDLRAVAIARAVEWLDRGEPVAVPTETVYGLAADATRPEAVVRIFEAKGRPFFDPLIVHVPTQEWLHRVADVAPADTDLLERLIEKFWPGPLTILLPRRAIVPDLVCSGLPTVAVRLSSHPIFQEVVQSFGRPLAAPSANRFGRLSPTTVAHVLDELRGRIPMIIDAGPAIHGIESTIVRITNSAIQVLRAGAVTIEELKEVAPATMSQPTEFPEAPGQLKSHYAPRTPLVLVDDWDTHELPRGLRYGLLAWQSVNQRANWAKVEILSTRGDLREATANLFSALRRLDDAALDRIIAEPVPETGLGIAIMDRLRKAAVHG